MGSLVIDVFNTPFVIKANESDEYLEKLLGYYKKIAQQIKNSNSLQNDLQVAALAGIMLCDELYKEKSKISQISKGKIPDSSIIVDKEKSDEAERKAKKMIAELNKVLDDKQGIS